MLLFFSGQQILYPIVYVVGFLGFIVAPCLAAIGLYRMYSGRVSDKAFKRSLSSIGVFTIVSFAIYPASYLLFQWESKLHVDYILYCLTIPFGIVASVGLVLNTQSTLIAVLVGVILNVTAMIGFVSLLYDRRRNNV